jgi:hypothetical protein
MIAKRRFSTATLATLRESKGLRIRAGNRMHRFIGIWVVVVDDRVFVRSWSLKPQGWYRTFLAELEVKSVAKTLSLGMTRCRPR